MAKILVVDGDEGVRETLQDLMTHLGHEVVTAPDGVEGVYSFILHRPDVVVAEFRLQENVSGEELIEYVRARGGRAILMSVEDVGEVRTRVRADAYLQKPYVTLENLKTVLAEALTVCP